MEYLAENTAPVWAVGAVLMTMALILYSHSRSLTSLLAVVAVVVLVAGGLVAERLIVTPREEVQAELLELLALIEDDDLMAVTDMLSSDAAEMRSDVQTLMPQFDIRKARATGEIEVIVDRDQTPHEASATFHFFADVRHGRSGMEGKYYDQVVIFFVRDGSDWLVSGYSTKKDWRKDAGRL